MPTSASSFMLVLALMWVPVIAIYVTLFSVGSGFGSKTEETEETVAPMSRVPEPVTHERHAA